MKNVILKLGVNGIRGTHMIGVVELVEVNREYCWDTIYNNKDSYVLSLIKTILNRDDENLTISEDNDNFIVTIYRDKNVDKYHSGMYLTKETDTRKSEYQYKATCAYYNKRHYGIYFRIKK